jgi:hypothetical protein
MTQQRRPTPAPRFDPWEIGLIAAGIAILTLVILALVYRILSILIGEQLTQLALALAVVAGLFAGLIAAVIQTLDRRELAEKQRLAEEEGRTL